MAVVGHAHIIVRAITDKVESDIRRGFSGANRIGGNSGKSLSDAFAKGFNSGGKDLNFFTKFANGLKTMRPGAKAAYSAFASLQRKAYTLTTSIGGLVGALVALGGGLTALGGAVLSATPALITFGQVMLSFKLASLVTKMAFKGIGGAVAALTQQQQGLGKTTREIREEMQQLAFDAEEAALSERRAGMSLEEARERLAMVQDLPPNSRARREAELAYAEADLNLRRAIDRNNDLQEQQEKGQKGFGNTAAASALAGLNEYQRAFAVFIAGLKPKIDALRLIVSKNLLPPLEQAINVLVSKGMPTLTTGFASIATAVGNASKDFAKIVTSTANLNGIAVVFEGVTYFLSKFGTTAGNLFSTIVILLEQATPLLRDFTNFLSGKALSLKNFVEAKKASGELRTFFDTAERLAGMIGRIIGNLGRTIGGIMAASVGPGSGGEKMLTWLGDVTEGWSKFVNSTSGKLKLSAALSLAADNTKLLLGLLGELVKTIVTGLNTTNLGEFLRIVKEAVPYVGDMLAEVGQALPAFGELIKQIARFFAAFAHSGAVKIFFETLGKIASKIADFFSMPWVQQLIKSMAEVHAFALVFGLIGIIGGKAFDIVVGGLAGISEKMGMVISGGKRVIEIAGKIGPALADAFRKVLLGDFAGALESIKGAFTKTAKEKDKFIGNLKVYDGAAKTSAFSSIALKGALTKVGHAFMFVGKSIIGFMKSPLGIVLMVVGAIIGALILLYKHSDTFKAQMDAIFAQLMGVLLDSLGQIMTAVQPLIPVLMDAFKQIMDAIMPLVPLLLDQLVPAFVQIIQAIMPLIPLLLTSLVPVIIQVVKAFVPLITMLITSLVPVIITLMNAFLPLIVMLITMLVPVIITVIKAITPLIVLFINLLLPILVKLLNAFMPIITLLINLLVPILTVVIQVFTQIIKIILDVVTAIISFLMPIITGIITAFSGLIGFLPKIGKVFSDVWNGIVNFFKGMINGLIGMFEGFINFVIDGLNLFMTPLRDAINGILQTLGIKFSFTVIPKVKIPRLAKGGTVMPSAGGSLVNIAEAGKPEKVVPLDANGLSKGDKAVLEAIKVGGSAAGGGVNINVQATEGMDTRELAEEVSRRLAFTMRRGSIA